MGGSKLSPPTSELSTSAWSSRRHQLWFERLHLDSEEHRGATDVRPPESRRNNQPSDFAPSALVCRDKDYPILPNAQCSFGHANQCKTGAWNKLNRFECWNGELVSEHFLFIFLQAGSRPLKTELCRPRQHNARAWPCYQGLSPPIQPLSLKFTRKGFWLGVVYHQGLQEHVWSSFLTESRGT